MKVPAWEYCSADLESCQGRNLNNHIVLTIMTRALPRLPFA